ncbi:hypothetical protein ACOMHN_022372 [Nucella lapillus]
MRRQPSTSTHLPAILLAASLLSCAAAAAGKPNILFIMMDDLGFNDAGFSDPRFHTPVLDKLRNGKNAIRFQRCGPSRAALLSGVYPWQGNAINSGSSAAIPLDHTILPQKLQTLGYQTHLVGKWHQGFCNISQTPTKLSFFGFYLTRQDHFSHMGKKEGYDFRSNLEVDRSVQGKYSTYIYSQHVRQLLREYKGNRKKSSRNFIVYVDQDLDIAMMIKNNMKLLRNQHRNPDWYNPPPGGAMHNTTDDLVDDPIEANNLKDDPAYDNTRNAMEKRLRRYRNKAADPIREDLNSDPVKYGYVWSSGLC